MNADIVTPTLVFVTLTKCQGEEKVFVNPYQIAYMEGEQKRGIVSTKISLSCGDTIQVQEPIKEIVELVEKFLSGISQEGK